MKNRETIPRIFNFPKDIERKDDLTNSRNIICWDYGNH